jgi:hypothetical protein
LGSAIAAAAGEANQFLSCFLQETGDNHPVHFVPCGGDCFFMVGDEKTAISYREDGEKKYLLLEMPGEKPHRLDKVNKFVNK